MHRGTNLDVDAAALRSYEDEIERWSAARLARLTGPGGWLSLVGLHWLRPGANTIGSDPGCAVVLPTGKAPPQVGTLEVDDDNAVVLRAIPGAGLTHDGREVTELALRDDAEGDPTVIGLGSLRLHVIDRDGRLAVRVRDPGSPARAAFRGIERFPVEPRWRIRAGFIPYEPPRPVRVANVLGFEETYPILGDLAFGLEDTRFRLAAFAEVGTTDLFIVFGDATNGLETYGGGRYLYAPPPDHQGQVVVDFNRAYNPPCVFTPHATCVLPLPENRLAVRIDAGEKRYPSEPEDTT
jgi:uncharacterized protein (DUF1684 family)